MLATDNRFKDKLGVIDLGTNSCHLVVAGVLDNDEINVLDSDKIPLRLGQHLDDDGYLTDEAITQTIDAVNRMREICNGHGAPIKAVATHAVRSAKNQHLLISRVQESCGVLIEPIDGFEEARLIFLGMRFGLSLGERCLGVDIGGGSTEIIFATNGTIQSVISLKLGAVTMNRRFLSTVPTPEEIDELQKFIDSQLLTTEPVNHTTAVISSGTGKALATIDHFLRTGQMLTDVNAYLLPQDNLQKIVDEICQLRASEKIRARFAIDKTRAEIILAGSLILLQIARRYRVEHWTVSSCCLREGIVLDTFDVDTDHHATRWQSIVALGEKYQIDRQHAQRVNGFSLKLLAKLQPCLLPTIDNRQQTEEMLAAAAYLHEIGKSIAYAKYHKHSSYLILHGQLLGFNQREKEIIARIARHHRKATPPTIEHLSTIDNRTIEVLATILRIAVAVLRSRPEHDFEVTIEQTNNVLHFTFGYPDERGLELFSLYHEQPAIEKMLGTAVTFVTKGQQ